jgi:hypothetical protein
MSTQPAPITLWYIDAPAPHGRRHWFADKPAALAARRMLMAAHNTAYDADTDTSPLTPALDHHYIIMPADVVPTVAGLLEFVNAYAYVVEHLLRSDVGVEC